MFYAKDRFFIFNSKLVLQLVKNNDPYWRSETVKRTVALKCK